MLRNLSVEIDHDTWPGSSGWPESFNSSTQDAEINVFCTLLLIGQLTTPTLASGVSLAEFWAWVRYIYAIADCTKLRLTSEYATLDSHQKMVLSDDFGMGFNVQWLIEPLKLCAWSDGREFVQRFSALTTPMATKPKKRGPEKCPDFVFLSSDEKLHVIECKGTQSGSKARNRQLDFMDANNIQSGGKAQKHMISIAPPLRGERLACGLAINGITSPEDSSLRIIDPDGSPIVTVGEDQRDLAYDPILRNTLARVLRASGLHRTADVVAAPSGDSHSARRLRPSSQEDKRLTQVFERRRRAQTELANAQDRPAFKAAGYAFHRRAVTLDLPRNLHIGKVTYTRVEIEQGLNREYLEKIGGGTLDDLPLMHCAPWVREKLRYIKTKGDHESGELLIGDLFRSRIAFLR